MLELGVKVINIQQIKDYLREGFIANMLYTQWNYDEAVSVEREEAYEDGREAGKAEGRAQGMTEGVRHIIYNF